MFADEYIHCSILLESMNYDTNYWVLVSVVVYIRLQWYKYYKISIVHNDIVSLVCHPMARSHLVLNV